VLTRDVSRTGTTEEQRYVYDDADHVASKTVENAATDLTTRYHYDTRGLLTQVIDPRGTVTPADFTTDIATDALGRQQSVTSPPLVVEPGGGTPSTARTTSTTGFDTYGDSSQRRDPDGNITATAYDRDGRQTKITYPTYTAPAGTTVTALEKFAYDPVGNLLSHTDRRNETTDYTYDDLNRVIQQLDPLVSGAGARGALRFTYDDTGFGLSRTDQDGAVTRQAPDDLGRVRTATQDVRQPGPTRHLTSTFDYDDLGNQTLAKSPLGEQNRRLFDAASELTRATDPLGQITTDTYDVDSRVLTSTDPLNRETTRVYDLAGREVEMDQRGSNGAVVDKKTYTYDAAGNTISSTTNAGTRRRTRTTRATPSTRSRNRSRPPRPSPRR